MTKPFRFGVMASRHDSLEDLADHARRAEEAGFSILLVSDHFGDALAPLPTLAVASQVSALRIGTLVLANDFRHPAAVAKEAATIDLLSEGRLELGLGTGWLVDDYERSGIPLDPPATRVDRLEEAIAVLKGIWSGEEFSYEGEHYQVAMAGHPVPIQRPHPPLLIAGSGPRMLGIAGREADIVSITATAGQESRGGYGAAMLRAGEGLDQRVAQVAEAADGRSVELNVLVHEVVVTDQRREAAERLGAGSEVPPDVVLESPHVLVGSHDEIAATLMERRERFGISYIAVGADARDDLAPVVRRLAGT